jgi:hypothetical protein
MSLERAQLTVKGGEFLLSGFYYWLFCVFALYIPLQDDGR